MIIQIKKKIIQIYFIYNYKQLLLNPIPPYKNKKNDAYKKYM